MLEWSDVDIAVRDAVREFVDKEIRPHVDALESGEMDPYGIIRKLFATFGIADMARDSLNKRLARLGAKLSLVKSNLCPLTFLDVPERAYVDAILGVYEMNRIELLRDLFVWAYERSTQQYMKVKSSLKEPDPVRLKYLEQTHEILGMVVRELKIPARKAVIVFAAAHVNRDDQSLFVDMVMDDLRRLHEGVIARYRIRPSEFAIWKKAVREGGLNSDDIP